MGPDPYAPDVQGIFALLEPLSSAPVAHRWRVAEPDARGAVSGSAVLPKSLGDYRWA